MADRDDITPRPEPDLPLFPELGGKLGDETKGFGKSTREIIEQARRMHNLPTLRGGQSIPDQVQTLTDAIDYLRGEMATRAQVASALETKVENLSATVDTLSADMIHMKDDLRRAQYDIKLA